MTYLLQVRAIPNPSMAIADKHKKVTDCLVRIPAPWGLQHPMRQLTVTNTEPLSILNLRSMIGRGIKGSLNYSNRACLTDEPMSDDWLDLEFDAQKVDYASLVETVIPLYVDALGAYAAWIANKQLMLEEFDAWQDANINYRHGIFRIQAANFWGRDLCHVAFGLKPAEMVRKLKDDVEIATTHHDGAYIVVSRAPMTPDEIRPVDARIRKLLGVEPGPAPRE